MPFESYCFHFTEANKPQSETGDQVPFLFHCVELW